MSFSRSFHRPPSHRAPVSFPRVFIRRRIDRAFLAVGDRFHTVRIYPKSDHVIPHGIRPAFAKRQVVFTRTAFVRMTLDRYGNTGIAFEPNHLVFDRCGASGARSKRSKPNSTRSPTLTTKSSTLPGACVTWRETTPLVTGPPVPAEAAPAFDEPSAVAVEFSSGDDSHAAGQARPTHRRRMKSASDFSPMDVWQVIGFFSALRSLWIVVAS